MLNGKGRNRIMGHLRLKLKNKYIKTKIKPRMCVRGKIFWIWKGGEIILKIGGGWGGQGFQTSVKVNICLPLYILLNKLYYLQVNLPIFMYTAFAAG